jgi:polysaccharide export outer membrane protein
LFKALNIDSRRVSGRRVYRLAMVAALLLPAITACQTIGPSRGSVQKAAENGAIPGLHVVDVTTEVAERTNLQPLQPRDVFAAEFSGAEPTGTRVGVGDILEVTIWEASPPALFGTTNFSTDIGSGVRGSSANDLPGLVVGPSGTISIPFAGDVPAAGRTVQQIGREIVRRLQGRAHLPQAIVRVAENVTSTVTVLGAVKDPKQVSLTPHGERVLDALSKAGGTTQPLDKMTIQLTRGGKVGRMAARDIVADPRNNVVLAAGDVVTAFFQPYNFTVLGAAGKNEEIPFEATGITLSQALGRIGGLQSDRADPKGVFIFRWEQPQLVQGPIGEASVDGAPGVPVIYRVNMKDPQTYLAAQKFEMRNGDVVYVSNSPVADFQRFVGVVASSILPISTVRSVVP